MSTDDPYLEDRETEVAEWCEAQAAAEVARLKECGQRSVLLVPKNMAIVRKDSEKYKAIIVNRVEVGTGFDFNKVRQIMLSPKVACPVKEGFEYCNVLLFTEKPVPIILPYLFDASVTSNTLNEWEFVNSSMASSRHSVEFDEDVAAAAKEEEEEEKAKEDEAAAKQDGH